MNESQSTREVDLVRLLKAVLKRWWIVIPAAVAVAVAFFFYTKFMVTPMYQATSIMYINASTSSTITMSELETAQRLINSYEYLIKDIPPTLTEVADKLNEDAKRINQEYRDTYESIGMTGSFPWLPEDYTREQLRSMISVKGGGTNTEFLEITVTCANPSEAARIANRIMDVVPGRAAAANMNSTISPAGWASDPSWDNPTSPNVTKNTVLGFFIGFFICAAIIILIELLDDRVKTDDWLRQTYGEDIPLLAVIPSAARAARQDPYSAYYNQLLTPDDPTV